MAEPPIWMQDIDASSIPKEKLDFLRSLVEGGQGKNQKEMMLYMMQSMKYAKANGITFSPSELSLLADVVKKHTPPEDLEKISQMLKQGSNNNKKASP